jgi:hypothetical protein
MMADPDQARPLGHRFRYNERMTNEAPSRRSFDVHIWDHRWLLLGTTGVILFSLAALAMISPAWRWSLFWWGVLIGQPS